MIAFVEKFSIMISVYPLRHKDKTHVELTKFLADVAPIGSVKDIHTDNAGEYLS